MWERVAPDGLEHADWHWTDERLGHLRELGLRPIAGLVHHGSGLRHTSLAHASFAVGLGDYAARVAERYPWLELCLDPRLVLAAPAAEFGWIAPRPRQSVLRSGRGSLMPPLGAALGCYAEALRAGPRRISSGTFLTHYRPPG